MNTQFTFFKVIVILFAFGNLTSSAIAQNEEADSGIVYTEIYDLPATIVKDQNRSGTCWAFAGISFLESEILKAKGDTFDLSEMYTVRYTYPEKAEKYVRLHGNAVFGPGGQAHDVTNVIRDYGIVPESVYNGMEYGASNHNHGELDALLKGMSESIIKRRGGKLTTVWFEAVNAVVDIYLGKVPEEFEYDGSTYSPGSFAEMTGLDPDDYIEITSYMHHPFYESFQLEVPDNWSNDYYFNLPLDELIEVMDHAIENGFTVCWDGDVSDKGFTHSKGVASFDEEVTQELRQEVFDNYTATDDHLMHITGIVEDQDGIRYYKTKNSWAEDSNDFGGYLNMSESYIRLKTVAIMVNKDALPKDISKKLGIK